jgi:aspartate/methionine/tyrosine aminotransferase
LNEDTLRKSISKKTKFLIINSPNNPTGKIFTKSELEIISKISIEFDLLVLSDEVYEFLIFENLKHERLATYPNMWERTLTVSSSSKTFSVTGFKVGWVIAPEKIITQIFKVNQTSTFCVNTPLQRAVAKCLVDAKKNDFANKFNQQLESKCNFLCVELEGIFGKGSVIKPQGGYFIIVDISSITNLVKFETSSSLQQDDVMCRWMIKNVGVTFLPLSAFMSNSLSSFDEGKQYCRVCFAKKDETLKEAIEKLKKLK